MNHWITGKHKIVLFGQAVDPGDRVVSIKRQEDGNFRVREECDRYFNKVLSKQEIVDALQEAIDWINAT